METIVTEMRRIIGRIQSEEQAARNWKVDLKNRVGRMLAVAQSVSKGTSDPEAFQLAIDLGNLWREL